MFGDLFCGCRAVQNQFRKDSFRSAADTTVQIVADLTGDQLGVRSLGGKNQMDTKGTVQPYDGGHPALDLTDTLPLGLCCRRQGWDIPALQTASFTAPVLL